MKLRLTSTTTGLAVGITAAVATAFATGAYFYSRHHFKTLLKAAHTTALAQAELIREALDHQMIENDRSLIAQMIESFGRQTQVEQVMLLDRSGAVRYSSAAPAAGTDLSLESPTCQACHRLPASQRGSIRVIEVREGSLLRTVVPLRNRAACHGCHDPRHGINGVLILDYDVGELRAAMNRDLRVMVAGSGVLALLLIAGIAGVVRVVVLRRLQRFETTARQIAAGDLERRVPAGGGPDTITWLAREFNVMADSMAGLVGEVRHERERLETVINSIDDGIAVFDLRRNVVAANAAFLRRAGETREQVVGCACRAAASGLCAPGDCPTLVCLGSGQHQSRMRERRGRDGRVVCEEVHTSPIRDSSGAVVQVVEVWRDITDRRAAEARLAESHRLASLGLLASGFSHEVNTPLATVLTCVEGILRAAPADGAGEADWKRVGENAAIAREQILRCRGITQHFLRLSRGHASAGEIVPVRASVGAVARLVEPTARAEGVQVRVEDVDPNLHVRADDAELQHTLVNLMLNAIQACRPGGSVVVEAVADEQVHIRVRDDGCGIAPEELKRIFEPFFSLRQGGTGLGLFLSLNFVRRFDGDILVTSAPGAGSTFDVVLPRLGSAVARAERAS